MLETHYFNSLHRDTKVCWIQDEPANQGAFQFAKLHIDRILANLGFGQREMGFLGRRSVHSFCAGAAKDHARESDKLWKDIKEFIES